jgi:hypothetical protein
VLVPSPRRRRGSVGLCYGSDGEWSLRGRCELHDAWRVEWRASVVLPLRSPAAFIGNEVAEVMGRDPVLQAGYRQYVES